MTARTMMLVALSLLMACREGAVPADQPATVPAAAPAQAVVAPPAPVEPTFTDSTWSADSSMYTWVASWDSIDSSELWLGHRDGRASMRLDARREYDGALVPLYTDRVFSLDGTRLFFTVPQYVTSRGVATFDLEMFELVEHDEGAHEIRVIPRGPYAGMVVLLQGRIVEGVGRVLQYWLYTPEMEPIRKIADEDGYDAWAAKHIPPR